MNGAEFVVRSRRAVTPRGVRPASVRVRGGRIAAVGTYSARTALPIIDVGSAVLFPGLVDSHVHVNEPGRTSWEGFKTATRAAAAGGVTTIVDMPLNSDPVTTTLAAFKRKLAAARGQCLVDCGFWGGLVPGNARQLELLIRAGVLGFKCFLVDSGIPEFPPVTEKDLRAAMPILARHGAPLLVHAELACTHAGFSGDPKLYSSYLASRPKAWENEAVRLMVRLARETRCRVHIVHLSSAEAAAILAGARRGGTPITAETCPHYLTFEAGRIGKGRTEFKCSPPIREKENREALWTALKKGVLGSVVSDHSPCLPRLKKGDFHGAWGGISGLQFTLPVVWTQARRRGFTLRDLARWLCEGPAELAGLSGRKGSLAPGADADLTVFDPEASFTVRPSSIRHRHRLTPYAGLKLRGVVRATFSRGSLVYVPERAAPEDPSGNLLLGRES